MKIPSIGTLLVLVLFSHLSADSQKINLIKSDLDSFERELGFSGVVLLAKGDNILLHKGYGKADKNDHSVTDKNTVYNIASVTKAFTAVAMLKLAEEGKLKIHDSLGKHLSNVPETSKCITIHQLLSHYSGIPQTYAAEGENNADKAAKKIFKVKLEAQPGSKFIYSNGNYTLLALIIEKVTGRTWEEYIKGNILTPLEMKNTYFWADQNHTGFPEVKRDGKEIKRTRDYGQLGSTGIFSTATDIQRFLTALHSNRIITATSREFLLGKYTKLKSLFPNSTDYASYGVFQTEGEVNSIWVRGSEDVWGVSIGYWLPNLNYYVIVLSDKEKLSNGSKQHIYVSSRIVHNLNKD